MPAIRNQHSLFLHAGKLHRAKRILQPAVFFAVCLADDDERANYNALEVTLQHKMMNGIQFDFNYTYSKSIDFASMRNASGSGAGLGGQIINSWIRGGTRRFGF